MAETKEHIPALDGMRGFGVNMVETLACVVVAMASHLCIEKQG